MSLFQNSVLNRFLKQQDKDVVSEAIESKIGYKSIDSKS